MSPFQGQSPAPERPGNSLNSLLRRLRPTSNCGAAPQPCCKNSINSNLRRERPERAVSPQPRATPWVSAFKRLRPVRAKVWANGWLLLLPFQGVGNGTMVPRALPRALDLLGFQPAQGRRQGFLRTIPPFDISIFPLPITQKEPHTARCLAPFVLISVKRYIIG